MKLNLDECAAELTTLEISQLTGVSELEIRAAHRRGLIAWIRTTPMKFTSRSVAAWLEQRQDPMPQIMA